MNWSDLQSKRLENIREWYVDNYVETPYLPSVIKYMVLWAVLNALYNLAYLPARSISKVSEVDGYRIPLISTGAESEILKKFARKLSEHDGLISQLMCEDILGYLQEFAHRRPDVYQPNQKICCEVKNKPYTFTVDEFRGIASIDRRVYRDDGSVLYQYSPFDLKLDEAGRPQDRTKFMRQLVRFLYQLRNNIVHGGSAFVSTKKMIATQALPVLETIVDYVFAHDELVITGDG